MQFCSRGKNKQKVVFFLHRIYNTSVHGLNREWLSSLQPIVSMVQPFLQSPGNQKVLKGVMGNKVENGRILSYRPNG